MANTSIYRNIKVMAVDDEEDSVSAASNFNNVFDEDELNNILPFTALRSVQK